MSEYACPSCGTPCVACNARTPAYAASIAGPFAFAPTYTVTIRDDERHVVTVFANSFAQASELAHDLVRALTAEATCP